MKKKIIIFDDDQDILLVTSTILKRNGYEVMCREDCRTLDTDLSTFEPSVILMDNWMPDKTGVEAIRYLKSHPAFKDIPVIFFSANSNLESLATNAGADRLLKKPFDLDELRQTITSLVPD